MRRAAVVAILALSLVPACGTSGSMGARRGEAIRFTTDDGVELAGELRGEGDIGVVFAHMFPTDRTSWASFATVLGDGGFRTLTFDFRGYGDSGGEKDIPEIWRDVVAAARALRDDGATRVVLVGASMGGSAALRAAAEEPVDGVVTLSAPSTFMGLTASPEVLAGVTAPKLFLAADGDGIAAQTAQSFYEQSPPPKRVEIVTGTEHGTDLLEGRQSEVVRRLVTAFIERFEPQAP
ncbi:MAG: alpha/beta hydrolase [Actinomycetota bacterium]